MRLMLPDINVTSMARPLLTTAVDNVTGQTAYVISRLN